MIDTAIILVVGAIMIGIAVWIAIATYTALKNAKEMEAIFSRSNLAIAIIYSKNGNLRKKVLLVNFISAAICFPKIYIKRGLIDKEDLDLLPAPLAKKLKALHYTSLVLMASLLTTFIIGKYILKI